MVGMRFTLTAFVLPFFFPLLTASAQCCGDCNDNGVVTIDEILTTVANALDGCSIVSTPVGGSTPRAHGRHSSQNGDNSLMPTKRPTPRTADLKERRHRGWRLTNANIPVHQHEAIAELAHRLGTSKAKILIALLDAGLESMRALQAGRN
jgi:hypothetical protein